MWYVQGVLADTLATTLQTKCSQTTFINCKVLKSFLLKMMPPPTICFHRGVATLITRTYLAWPTASWTNYEYTSYCSHWYFLCWVLWPRCICVCWGQGKWRRWWGIDQEDPSHLCSFLDMPQWVLYPVPVVLGVVTKMHLCLLRSREVKKTMRYWPIGSKPSVLFFGHAPTKPCIIDNVTISSWIHSFKHTIHPCLFLTNMKIISGFEVWQCP